MAIKLMKAVFTLSLLALACLLWPAAAHAAPFPGAPSYPGATGGGYTVPAAGAGLYNGQSVAPISPTLPPPQMGSPYTGPTMMEPTAMQPMSYGYPQPAPANSWGIQQAAGVSMLNYSYIEAGYRYIDPKGGAYNGSHGLGLSLVMALPTIFFLKGSFNWTSGSGTKNVAGVANADYSLSTITIGGGAYMAITQKLHFVGEVGLVYANFDADGINRSYTDGGIYIRPSLRYQLVDWLELQAGATVSSTSDYDSKIIDFGGYFRVLPQLDVHLGADFGDATRTLKAGARLRW